VKRLEKIIFDCVCVYITLPVPPEPLSTGAGNGVHAPVDEDPKLGFVVPTRQRAGVD
jgi:hypothetical protein